MEEPGPKARQTERKAPNVDSEAFVPLSGHRFHDRAAQRLSGRTKVEVAGDADDAQDWQKEKEEQDEMHRAETRWWAG